MSGGCVSKGMVCPGVCRCLVVVCVCPSGACPGGRGVCPGCVCMYLCVCVQRGGVSGGGCIQRGGVSRSVWSSGGVCPGDVHPPDPEANTPCGQKEWCACQNLSATTVAGGND